MPRHKEKWYADGLRFSCNQCGNCCSGPRGYVWFHLDELNAMADYLGMLPQEFLQQYARKVDGHYTLNEMPSPRGYDCVFLKYSLEGKALCSIYPVRPQQCRTWPFWPDNLQSKRTYAGVARATPCEGMQRGLEGEGAFIPIEEIRIRRDATPR